MQHEACPFAEISHSHSAWAVGVDAIQKVSEFRRWWSRVLLWNSDNHEIRPASELLATWKFTIK